MIKNLLSNAKSTDSVPGQETKIPTCHAVWSKKKRRKYCRNDVMSPKRRSEELLLLSTRHQQGTSHLHPRQLGLRTLLARLPVSGSQSMPGQDAPGFSLTGQCLGELGPGKAGLYGTRLGQDLGHLLCPRGLRAQLWLSLPDPQLLPEQTWTKCLTQALSLFL